MWRPGEWAQSTGQWTRAWARSRAPSSLVEPGCAEPRLRRSFRLEARWGARLKHENVVTLYEYGEADGIPFLALEYVDGVNLRDYIAQKGRLDVGESCRIILQATRAIGYLHKHGIVHQDIKPSVFLVKQQKGLPFVKLVDLGLARRGDDGRDQATVTGTRLGTVDYLAPERVRVNGTADVRSDIYSLGCIWYHMLFGEPPFAVGTVPERLYNLISTAPLDIRKSNPRLTDAMISVLSKTLAKNPAERYQTPEDLLRA